MEKYVYFRNDNQEIDYCSGDVYLNFLDYAFEEADHFMLVYVNYYGKGYTSTMKAFKKSLEPFKIKSRTNPSWPGTPNTFAKNTTYKIVFYKNHKDAKEILKKVSCLSGWTRPNYPQDLAFFKGNQCWFYSISHEKIGVIIHATDDDIDFVVKNNLALRESVKISRDDSFDEYDEELV